MEEENFNMNEQFEEFLENLELTSDQKEDAKTKYNNVCKTLHKNYYEGNSYNGDTKYLFGSYKNKTNVRPPAENQDVDVLFKMPEEEFERFDNHDSNGQSNLLQEIKSILKETFSTTDTIKAWGKVVLVNFEGIHNIEVLPAWENENGTFKIPNTENQGSWEEFDPRAEIKNFKNSNDETSGLTRNLIKMVKCWRNNIASSTLTSFEIQNLVISFCKNFSGAKNYSKTITNFFRYILDKVDDGAKSYVETAVSRSERALKNEEEGECDKAVSEWRKIFKNQFPQTKQNNLNSTEIKIPVKQHGNTIKKTRYRLA